MRNLPTTPPADDKGTTETAPRFVASGIIRRRTDRQEVALISETGDYDFTVPLVAKGDTRRQVSARLAAAGGAR